MTATAIAGISFACVFGGAVLGTALRGALPDHHLGSDSRDLVKLGTGLIGTMAALVLSLLVASAKSSYDAQRSEIMQISAKIVVLDHAMAQYGPKTHEARDLLSRTVSRTLERIWPADRSAAAQLDPTGDGSEVLYDQIQRLVPQNDEERSLRAEALSLVVDLGGSRWLMFEQGVSSISMPFLVVVLFWLTMIFVGFGLLAPPHPTAIAVLFVCSLSVAIAVFLILELDQPFQGLIQISSAPLRNALAHLGP